jgi:GT2 family glycosyltransferase
MKEFIARCTVTVGTAQALVEKLTEAGAAHPQYLPNAADERIFDCYKSYERPTDYPRGFPRTLLYFGSLYGEWFAWDYLRAAAEQNRTTGFVLIGDNPGKVPMPSNVIFLGGKSNAELPAYLAAADAAMIPFAPCKITDAVSPIKVFEYLFLKKPVIATRMIELDGYPNVRQAESPAEFARLCGAVPKFDERAADEFISRNSWQSRLDQMIARDTLKRRFSFIILTHNNHRVLERCLRTLIENTRGIDSEIIVVDNCSTDGGDLMVEREFPQVRLLRNQRNGCSSGRNLGVAAATGDCLTFIDSDQWFTSAAWLYEADYILRHHPIVGAVGWAAGWLDVSRSPLGGDIVDYLPNRGVNVQGFRTDVAYLGTGGMFVPRRVWEQLDGFDEFYDPTCFEDTDLSFQIRRTGLLLAYRDLTGIRHQPHQTTQASGGSARYRELFARNSYYFKNKWQSHPQFFVADGQRRQAA